MLKQVRVLQFISGLKVGGAEKVLTSVVNGVNHSTCSFQVVCLGQEGPGDARLKGQLVKRGIKVSYLGVTAMSPWRVLRLIKVIRQYRPDVLHTWMYRCDFIGAVLGRLCRVKRVLWSIRGSANSLLVRKKLRKVARWCARLSSGKVPESIVCVSERAARTHANIGCDIKKMITVTNGFDTEKLFSSEGLCNKWRASYKIGSDQVVVGSLGRYAPEKNYDEL